MFPKRFFYVSIFAFCLPGEKKIEYILLLTGLLCLLIRNELKKQYLKFTICISRAKQTNKQKNLGLVFKIQADMWGKYTGGEVPGRAVLKNIIPGFLQLCQELKSHSHPH